jgi:hypothetical protein
MGFFELKVLQRRSHLSDRFRQGNQELRRHVCGLPCQNIEAKNDAAASFCLA